MRPAPKNKGPPRRDDRGPDGDVHPTAENKRVKLTQGDASSELVAKYEKELQRLHQTIVNQTALIKQRGETLKSYRNVNNDKSAEVAELKQEMSDLEQEWKDAQQSGSMSRIPLNTTIRSLEDQVIQLKTDLESKDEGLRDARDFIVELQSSKPTDSLQSKKVIDNDIELLWSQLVFNVRQFVHTYLGTHHSQPPSQTQRWNDLISRPEVFFASLYGYRLAFEAHVWFWLCREVFDSYSPGWGGETGRQFYKTVKKAQGTQTYSSRKVLSHLKANKYTANISTKDQAFKTLQAWRANSVAMLSSLKSTQDDMARHKDAVGRTLAELFQPRADVDLDPDQATQDMQDIFKCALDLTTIFRQSKAVFSVLDEKLENHDTGRTVRHGFSYNPGSLMALHRDQSQNIPNGTKVDMIVSPALVKQGTADGENYTSIKVLVKMTVVSGMASSLEQDAFSQAAEGACQDIFQVHQEQHDTDTQPPFSKSQDEEMIEANDKMEVERPSDGMRYYSASAGRGNVLNKQEQDN